jgi:hypothetical protein
MADPDADPGRYGGAVSRRPSTVIGNELDLPSLERLFTHHVDVGELQARLEHAHRGRHILVACMPKSGSTFLSVLLSRVTGYTTYPLVHRYGGNEQDVYLPAVLGALHQDTVTQQHVTATDTNLELLQLLSVRPIVLVRNILDVVVSLLDHLHDETIVTPMCTLTPEFHGLEEDVKLDLIIDLALPWYFRWYVSWYEALRNGTIETLWVTYERLFRDQVSTVAQVLAFLGLPADRRRIEDCIDGVDLKATRFNKAVAGRGVERLSSAQQRRVRHLTRYYPSVDFSSIGLSVV